MAYYLYSKQLIIHKLFVILYSIKLRYRLKHEFEFVIQT
jgi:hypothetical protein